MTQRPDDLLYSREHEWIRIEDGEATVGVTDFAQEELGDVVYVECATVGTELALMDVLGTVESVKSVSDLFAPIAGEVIAVNDALEASPELVNEDCYGEGWIVRLRIEPDADMSSLIDSTAYAELTH